MQLRKTMLIHERIETDETGAPCAPLTRVAAMAVIRNPAAGEDREDLSQLVDIGAKLGAMLAAQIMTALGLPAVNHGPVTYGKAAIVGAAGVAEHGAAVLHPSLGAPVREAIGGGRSLMPSNVKVAGAGAAIDLPLGHKDDAWSFDHIDTMTLSIPDAPRPDEIVVCIAMSDGPRPRARARKPPA
ncbi:MAG: hypothetical protein ACJA1L_003503 [Paracoccaceae bacterium]|jgi:hypothetical protein